MKNFITTLLVVTSFALSGTAFADEKGNKEICTKEYTAKEPMQREVCKQLGDKCPRMRDCLRDERAKSGGAANDTATKNVERHLKCLADTVRNGCKK
jgi:hypothetical protein